MVRTLDEILAHNLAQPVGDGYIDIIVRRENYRNLLKDLIEKGYEISCISWWEYVDRIDRKSRYGLGGPRSEFYKGWFSEICTVDEIEFRELKNPVEDITSVIENKIIDIGSKNISFDTDKFLTPAFWLGAGPGI